MGQNKKKKAAKSLKTRASPDPQDDKSSDENVLEHEKSPDGAEVGTSPNRPAETSPKDPSEEPEKLPDDVASAEPAAADDSCARVTEDDGVRYVSVVSGIDLHDLSQSPEMRAISKSDEESAEYRPNLSGTMGSSGRVSDLESQWENKLKVMAVELEQMKSDRDHEQIVRQQLEDKIAEITSTSAETLRRHEADQKISKIALDSAKAEIDHHKEVNANLKQSMDLELAEQIRAEKELRQELEAQLHTTKSNLEQRECTIKQLGASLETINGQLDCTEKEVIKVKSRAEAAEQSMVALETKLAQVQADLESSKEENNSLQCSLDEATNRIKEEFEANKDSVTSEITKAVESVQETIRMKLRSLKDHVKNKYQESAPEIACSPLMCELPESATVACSLDNMSDLYHAMMERLEVLSKENLDKQTRLSMSAKEISDYKEEIAKLKNQVSLQEATISELKSIEQSLRTELKEVQAASASADRRLVEYVTNASESLKKSEADAHELKLKLEAALEENARTASMLNEVTRVSEQNKAGYDNYAAELKKAADETSQLLIDIAEQKSAEECKIRLLNEQHAAALKKCIQSASDEVEAQVLVVKANLQNLKEENDKMKASLQAAENEAFQAVQRNKMLEEALLKAHGEHVEIQKKAEATIADFNRQKLDLQNIMHDFTSQMSNKTEEVEALEQTLRAQIKEQLEQQYKKQIDTLQKRFNGSSRAIIELETELSQKNLLISNLNDRINRHEQQSAANNRTTIGATQSSANNQGNNQGFFRFF